MGNSSGNGDRHNVKLSDLQKCYFAALIYGLRLIHEKAEARGELYIPIDFNREKCRPVINAKDLIDFVQKVGDRIAGASL